MNLLIDQREETNVQEPGWTPETAEQPVSPLMEEPALPRNAETPLDYYNFDEPEGQKRSILGPVLIILLLLAAIGAAAYYGFFYKPEELGEFQKSAQQAAPQTAEPAPVLTEPAVTESASTTGPAVESATAAEPVAESAPAGQAPDTGVPASSRPEPARLQPAATGNGSPLARAAGLLGGILAARPDDLHVSTLILDQNSFSAEVSAQGRAVIENYANALKSSVPGGLTSSPASGYYSGARALVTGTFPSISPPAQPAVDAAGLTQIKEELRATASEAGLKVIEVSQAKPIQRSGESWTTIFAKVSGSESQFEAYCLSLAGRLPQMRLDKIILQTDKAQKTVGVLRLEARTR